MIDITERNDKFSLADITGLSRDCFTTDVDIYKSVFPRRSRNFPPVKRRRLSLRRFLPSPLLKFRAGWRLWPRDEQIFFTTPCILASVHVIVIHMRAIPPAIYIVSRREKRLFSKEIDCLTTSRRLLLHFLPEETNLVSRVNYRVSFARFNAVSRFLLLFFSFSFCCYRYGNYRSVDPISISKNSLSREKGEFYL